MKKTLSVIIFLTVVIFTQSCHAFFPADQSVQWTQTLNGQWKFALNGPHEETFYKTDFDDKAFVPITVPGNWELQGFETPVYRRPDTGTGYYRRSFAVPSEWKERQVIIRFEGVLFGYDFWVNGQHIGSCESAFTRSEFDITKAINHNEKNTIAVKVYKARKNLGSRFDTHDSWALSGIQRDVILFALPQLRINDITIVTDLTPDLKKASIKTKFSITNELQSSSKNIQLTARLLDPAGQTAGTFSNAISPNSPGGIFAIKILNPLLWNAETPNLYKMDIQLKANGKTVHAFTRKVGIRKITIDGNVLKLNYKPIKIRGVDHHDTDPDVGHALQRQHFTSSNSAQPSNSPPT